MKNKLVNWLTIISFYIILFFLGRSYIHLRNYNLFVIYMFCLTFTIIILLSISNKKLKTFTE